MNEDKKTGLLYEQVIPLSLSVAVMAALAAGVFAVLKIINMFPLTTPVALRLRWYDILIGATIYLKTSVDFAIFMGRLMRSNPGWRNRIALEIGTAVGNGLGTILILVVWILFKGIHWLLAAMIFVAALILLELAYAGLENFASWQGGGLAKRSVYLGLDKFLSGILKYIRPVISRIIPDLGQKLRGAEALPWKSLLLFSFTVPFILGLDDFAGYVPLFNIVNVFGFSVGILGAHMLLNIALFISPQKTVAAVRNDWVAFLGSVAFIGLALWGFLEVIRLLFR